METKNAVEALSALAQEHRLAVFRLLVRQGPNAQSDFDNAAQGFTPVQMSEAQAQVSLGVDEKDRDYRLVTLVAYDDKAASAVAASPALAQTSSGYRGTASDPWKQLAMPAAQLPGQATSGAIGE